MIIVPTSQTPKYQLFPTNGTGETGFSIEMVDFGLTAYVVIQGDLITWQKHQIEQIPILFMILKFVFPSWAPRFKKNSGKYSSGLSCHWALFTTWASYFQQSWVQKTGLIFCLADFHGRNWRIPGSYKNKIQHWALFSTKTNQGRFYFHWA